MAGDGKNRWVVLLNRSPKGPLTEEEVKTLLAQGILRQNDIAFLVASEGGDKSKSEWKLLWQFPEFNRRQAEPPKPDKPEPKAPEGQVEERRRKIPPEEIQKRAMEDLPPDLMEIAPEDLLPRSTQIQFKPEPENISPAPEVALVEEKPESPSRSFDLRWAYGAVAVGLIAFLVVRIPSLLKRDRRAPRIEERDPATGGPIDALIPNTGGNRSAPSAGNRSFVNQAPRVNRPQAAPPTAPPASDRPSQAEVERERERERDKEREREEEARIAAENEAADETDSGTKKKVFKSRKPTTEEESAGASEESAPAQEASEPERAPDSPPPGGSISEPEPAGTSPLDQPAPASEDEGGR